MGASEFLVTAEGKTPKEAFSRAVERAQYDYGHAGYTGTIAEKREFVMIPLPADRVEGETDARRARRHAADLIDKGDERINDKWGPAGCIDCGNGEFVFFGWASS